MKIYLLNDSPRAIENYTNLFLAGGCEVIGSGMPSQKAFSEIAISRPDIVVSGHLELSNIEFLLASGVKSYICVVCDDENLIRDYDSEMQKQGVENVIFINSNMHSPKEISELILKNAPIKEDGDYDKEEENDEFGFDFEIENNSIDEKIEKYEKPQENEAHEEEMIDENELVGENNGFSVVGSNLKKENMNPLSLKTKVIHVHSKKGGTGKTIIAKEIANQFSAIKLPKKLNKEDSTLKTCIIDLDFERGNVRTHLGLEMMSPSIYDFIDDIVTKLEKGMSLDSIKYSSIQILSKFARRVNGGLYAIVTSQGEIPYSLYQRIFELEIEKKYQGVFKSIIDKIISSVRGVFDIVVLDTGAKTDEITISAYESSDVNLVVINPTIASFENTKVLLDELQKIETIDINNLAFVINKDMKKTGIQDDMDRMLNFLTVDGIDYDTNKMVKKNIPLAGRIIYDPQVILFENSYEFLTNSSTNFKKSIIDICEFILPVFKIKYKATGGKNSVQILKEIRKRQKDKDQELNNKMKSMFTSDAKEDVNATKSVINAFNNALGNDNVTNDNVTSPDAHVTTLTKRDVFDYEFPKKVTVDMVINVFKMCPDLKVSSTGIPIMEQKPALLSNKVWKQYVTLTLKRNKKKPVQKETANVKRNVENNKENQEDVE